jgi:hypothetical protein
MESRIGVKFGK